MYEDVFKNLLNANKKYTDIQIEKIGDIRGNKIISVDILPTSGDFKTGDLAFIKSTGDIYQYQIDNWVFQANIKGSGSVTQQDILDAIAETDINAKTLNGKEDTAFATSIQGTKADNAVPKSTTVNGKALTSNITINKTDVGLGNVDNTSDADKPISTATQNALNNKLNISQKGSNNGLAELDTNGKVPSTQLPSYVDDVLEYSSLSNFPIIGETGKIYLAMDTDKIYRWSGTTYIIVSETIALGETNSTAYRGDRGKIAYDHSQLTSGNPHNVTKTNIDLGNVDNTSDVNKPISTAMQIALNDKVPTSRKINGQSLTNDITLPTGGIEQLDTWQNVDDIANDIAVGEVRLNTIFDTNMYFIIVTMKDDSDYILQYVTNPFYYNSRTKNGELPWESWDGYNEYAYKEDLENLPISFELEENGDFYFVYGDD